MIQRGKWLWGCEDVQEEAKAYCEGYIQGIEDYIRIIKADIYSEKFSD